MKSELFEETLRQHKDGLTDELEQLGKHRQAQLVAWDIEQNESDYEFYFNAAWQEQQAKIDELQKQNAWLSDVAERENKRANNLQQDKTSTTILLGKTIQEKNELQKRIDEALVCVDQAKDGFYGFSCDGGDTDNLAKHLEKALRGASD